ncbi:MAG: hypothetical protein KDK24_00520 [Pseudooceanicola sp.]|nr:hypothetical protein [Pseudooceanicola sp.]
MSYVLAYDLGGSSLRAALVGADGGFVASVRRKLKIRVDRERCEADPEAWWAALESAIEALGADHDLARVTAVAGCGFTRTQVFLDADGAVLRPAITFQDARASALDIPGLGPFDPLARMVWVQREEPGIWARVARVLEPKDYLNLRLTGRAVSDTISQTPMTRVLGVDPGLLEQLGVDPELLPETLSPFAEVGAVAQGPLAGVPVYNGSIDTWACVLGSGALVPGVGYAISGTSDVSGVIASERFEAQGLLSVDWGPGLWQLGGPSQGAATRLTWALRRFFPRAEPAAALASALGARPGGPLFLPYLDGERTPFWDPALRGAFLGLSAAHDGADMLRSVAEGMNYLSREILKRAERATGAEVSHVCFSGGLSGTPALCQMKADVLNRTVLVPSNTETGLMGAARVAQGRSCGAQPPEGARYDPDPQRRAFYDDRFALFREAGAALAPLSRALARME